MIYFWNGISFDDFLIQNLNIKSTGGFVIVVILLMISAALYEGIRTFRDLLMDKFLEMSRTLLIGVNQISVQVKFAKDQSSNGQQSLANLPPLNITNCENDLCESINKFEEDNNVQIDIIDSPNHKQNGKSEKGDLASNVFTRYSLLCASTFLHMIQTFLGITLMLAIMSFNTWVLTSIAVGTGIGYFVFNHLRRRLGQGKEMALMCS